MVIPLDEIARAIKALEAAREMLITGGTDAQRGATAAECTIASIYLGVYVRADGVPETEH